MKLIWDKTGERLYETGVRNAVLYQRSNLGTYPQGVAWNGVTNITESPSGAEPTAVYADDIKYLTLMSAEELGGSIEAYMYPDEFAECDGSAEIAVGVSAGQQARQAVGLSYRTVLGNDTTGNEYGYKLHLLYNALASPSEKSYGTINDSPEVDPMSWEYTTTPEVFANAAFKPTALIVIDSTKVDKDKLTAFETILYGGEDTEASLPLPDAVVAHFADEAAG
jgi:hypothetical protein